MSYFDPSGDTNLLPKAYRDHEDLPTLAPLVEDDVIRAYTGGVPTIGSIPYGGKRLDDYRYVYLRGFEEDASLADAAFAKAMKRTIIEVLTWRLRIRDRDPSLKSESAQESSRTFRDGSDTLFPRAWRRWLEPYDVRPVYYSL